MRPQPRAPETPTALTLGDCSFCSFREEPGVGGCREAGGGEPQTGLPLLADAGSDWGVGVCRRGLCMEHPAICNLTYL